MSTIINGSSPSITFSDSTTQTTAGLPLTGGTLTGGLTLPSAGITFSDATTQTTGGTASKSSGGYQKLPSGVIIQWGSSISSVKNTFPITFPNAIWTVTGTAWYSGSATTATQLDWGSTDTTGVKFLVSQGGVLLSSQTIFYVAIGY